MWQFSKFLHLEVEEARCEVYDKRYLGKRKDERIACDIKSLYSHFLPKWTFSNATFISGAS